MHEFDIESLAIFALLCNRVNTSYADPPMMQQRSPLRREIACGLYFCLPAAGRVLRLRRPAEGLGGT